MASLEKQYCFPFSIFIMINNYNKYIIFKTKNGTFPIQEKRTEVRTSSSRVLTLLYTSKRITNCFPVHSRRPLPA